MECANVGGKAINIVKHHRSTIIIQGVVGVIIRVRFIADLLLCCCV